MPAKIEQAKKIWKAYDTEDTYNTHLNKLVAFFINQVQGKPVSTLREAANIVAGQQMHRRWNITEAIMGVVEETHNRIAISLMPEWLMEPFTTNLGFVALIGSTYVERDGLFTNEAYGIDKADAYLEVRSGDPEALDIHMGDTMGDLSLFALARRPILINPSWTLHEAMNGSGASVLISTKDLVALQNPTSSEKPKSWGPPFNAQAILAEVYSKGD
jgi:phosphoserine phosphatase